VSAPVTDERAHFTALKTLLDAALSPRVTYDYGTVPGFDNNTGTRPTIFALLAIERRQVPVTRSTATPTRSGWRVSVTVVGAFPDNVRQYAEKVTQALDGVRLTVDGVTSTPVQHESTQAIQRDTSIAVGQSGAFSGVSMWTFVL
jgi:hypothetical protein